MAFHPVAVSPEIAALEELIKDSNEQLRRLQQRREVLNDALSAVERVQAKAQQAAEAKARALSPTPQTPTS